MLVVQVSYVLDTEDIFRRIKPRKPVAARPAAPQPQLRFAEWLAGRRAAMPQPMIA